MGEKIWTALDIIRKPGGLPLGDTVDFEQMNNETAARHGKVGKKAQDQVSAYINHSRWVADCPNCNAGIACLPGVNQIVCLECGERYDVAWPADREGIESALLCRPQRNRHWRPGESVKDLKRENKQYGVGK